jgi:hypothetical protein
MRLTTSGLPGVEVTAKKFLKNTDPWRIFSQYKLKGKMKENIEANKEKASYLKL